MTEPKIEYRFRKPDEQPKTPPHYRRVIENGMIIERDIAIPLRDGVKVYADLFRPLDEKPAPPIIGWTPYGKHEPLRPERFLDCGVKDGDVSPYTAFEAPDPIYWVPHGYAVLVVDIRGTWNSEGRALFLAPEEAQDFYDVIEWAGTQPWSNGKVGLSGVSYLALMQWRVAELHPPHLAAINPWEGWADTYREVVRHGGIPSNLFWPLLQRRWGVGLTELEDLATETREHPFYDDYWRTKTAKLEKITTPAFVVASWTDQGLHTRGTLKGFETIASDEKWLDIHAEKKWKHYYLPDSLARLKTFFDHFLKGVDNEIATWPKVRLMVRDQHSTGTIRHHNEWPPEKTIYTSYYLDAASAKLTESMPAPAQVSYAARDQDGGEHLATFDLTFDTTSEVVGHMKLKLWVSAEDADDMDLFVGIHKFDAQGNEVTFPYYMQFDDGPVALGWLRVSHRELDTAQTTAYQPVLTHQRELKLKPGEIVPVEIEIWPSGTLFHAGERLRLVIQGSDIKKYPREIEVYARHEDSVNRGRHVIHTGGQYDSYLLLPVTRTGDVS